MGDEPLKHPILVGFLLLLYLVAIYGILMLGIKNAFGY